jgi:glycosyltransferase involved in cell wall biosynthesis
MLKHSIESVLMQSFEDYELIISDNASDDETESVVKSYDDPRVRYSRNTTNIGCLANWNRCLALAQGKYIGILPDDDLMLPENLAAKVDVLSRHPEVGLIHSKYHLIDAEGRIIQFDTN